MKVLNVHFFQHVPFEDPGCIPDWALQNRHDLKITKWYEDPMLPDVDAIDWLIVMGGPMSVHDEEKYGWLRAEKSLIREAIDAGKTVIGICFGAQLVAQALGANVYPNPQKEIGWFNVSMTERGAENPLLDGFDSEFRVFHWHGDIFDLPDEAVHLLQSQGCRHQAFLYGNHVLALQFHFEVTDRSLQAMVEHGKEKLVEDRYVQSQEVIMEGRSWIRENNNRMFSILSRMQEVGLFI